MIIFTEHSRFLDVVSFPIILLSGGGGGGLFELFIAIFFFFHFLIFVGFMRTIK